MDLQNGLFFRPPKAKSMRFLESGSHRVRSRAHRTNPVEWFRTDAKADEDYIVLGGWECRKSADTRQARWFSLRLEKAEVPWLFRKPYPMVYTSP